MSDEHHSHPSIPADASASDARLARKILALAAFAWLAAFFSIRFIVVPAGGATLRWDAGWYVAVAQYGYHFAGDILQSSTVAFMPALPLVEAAVLALGVPVNVAVPLVAVACALGGIALLHDGLAARFGALRSAAACTLLMAAPFSLYFLNGYSETLYLLLLGGFFRALWKQRNLPLAALFAGLATAVRPYGLMLAIVWAVELIVQARADGADAKTIVRRLVAFGPLTISGFVASSLYFYVCFGDLLLYRNILIAWSMDPIASPGDSIAFDALTTLRMLALDVAHPLTPAQVARALAWMTPVALIAAFRRIPAAATLYSLLLFVFIIVTTGGGGNLGRHLSTELVLPLAAVALIWPASIARPSRVRIGAIVLLVIAAAIMQAEYTILYFRGAWVS
jgi:hypothetical protein